jgi:hypothetical protein
MRVHEGTIDLVKERDSVGAIFRSFLEAGFRGFPTT